MHLSYDTSRKNTEKGTSASADHRMISGHRTASPKSPKIKQKVHLSGEQLVIPPWGGFSSVTENVLNRENLPEHPSQGVSEPEYPSQDCSALEGQSC